MSSSTYRSVLVGTDGSESSFRAVDRAAAVAGAAGAQLLLACAYRPMSAREVQEARDVLGGEAYKVSGATPAEDVLRDAADRARRAGAGEVDTLAVEGDAVDELSRIVNDRDVDLVVVGEGSLDAQTLRGKAPVGVARAAQKAGCRVVAVCGRRTLGDGQLREAGIDTAYALTDLEPDPAACMAQAAALLERVGKRLAADELD